MAFTRQRRTVSQPADGSDFTVTLVDSQADDNYGVFPTQVKGASLSDIMCPDDLAGDRTSTTFRVVTLAPLPDGAIIEFIVVRS